MPTQTPLPSPTPPLQSQFIFPEEPPAWLGNPTLDVLAIVTGRNGAYYGLSLVSASTGERYDLTVPEAHGIFWVDTRTLGLLFPESDNLCFVDLQAGVVRCEAFDVNKYRLLRGTQPGVPQQHPLGAMTPLLWMPIPGEEDVVALVADRGKYSSDLSLYADGMDDVRVWESETGALVWDSDPEDDPDASEVEFAWSPVQPHELAVVKGVYPDTDKGGDFFDVQKLVILDVARGKVMATYPGDFSSIQWSPNGDRLLYQRYEFTLYPMDQIGPPCVLDLPTGTSKCLENVPNTHFPSDRAFVRSGGTGLGSFRWDRAGEGFYYLYHGLYYERSQQPNPTPSGPFRVGGLCRYDLGTGKMACPTDGVTELEAQWITDYQISPDGEYAYVWAGEWDPPMHGIVDMKRGQFLSLPFEGLAPSSLWRPPSPQALSGTVRPARTTEQDLDDTPSIWDFFNLDTGLDLQGPGSREFSVEVSAEQTFIWPFDWCATDRATLDENLKSITVGLLIDEAQVAAENILEYEHESERWACHYWATKLSGWEEGEQVVLTVRYSFSEAVNDGRSEYGAGDYLYTLNVNVRGE